MWQMAERFARPARIAGTLLVVVWLCGCDSRSSTTNREGEAVAVSRGDTIVTPRDTVLLGSQRLPPATRDGVREEVRTSPPTASAVGVLAIQPRAGCESRRPLPVPS